MQTRRHFLELGAGTLVVVAWPGSAAAGARWDVSYLWSQTLAAVLAHRARVAPVLGAEAADLVVVVGANGLWGLVLDANRDEAGARALATEHHNRLRAVLGGTEVLALPLPGNGYVPTHHLRYGVFDDPKAAGVVRALVGKHIDVELGQVLVLEGTTDGRSQLLYRCHARPEEAQLLAGAQSKLLAQQSILVTAVADRFAAAVPAAPAKVSPAAVPKGAQPKADPDLPGTVRTPLRDAINAHIQSLRQRGVVEPDEATSWYVHTLHDDRTWVAINADTPRQCASMVKPFVALAFFHRVRDGRILYGDLSRAKMEAMIHHSDNEATNWAMGLVGGPEAVQRVLTQHYPSLFTETSIVEDIPTDGRTYRNRSSARDYVRFARALWRDELPSSHEIKRLMALPGRDRLFTGAPAIPRGTEVMNKTGTTSQLCGDFGILVAKSTTGQSVPYAFVGIIEKSQQCTTFSRWVASRGGVIRGVSNLTYRLLEDHYALV